MSSTFTSHYQGYLSAGYSVIPIMPGAKRPGYQTSHIGREGLGNWQEFCERQPSQYDLATWTGAGVTAGIGVALGYGGVVGIDLDYGDGDIRDAIESCLPGSDFRKVGAKGYTEFYYAPHLASRKFTLPIGEIQPDGSAKQESVIEILALGRQSVLPPTIHPETNEPYVWEDAPLSAVKPSALPPLPEDFEEQIEEALRAFGYDDQENVKFAAPPIELPDDMENYYPKTVEESTAIVKQLALNSLHSWVPALGVPVKRHGDGYRIQATWRGGDGWNVGINPTGIRDFARDIGMTGIDVVMETQGMTFDDAVIWLGDRVWPQVFNEASRQEAAENGRKLVENYNRRMAAEAAEEERKTEEANQNRVAAAREAEQARLREEHARQQAEAQRIAEANEVTPSDAQRIADQTQQVLSVTPADPEAITDFEIANSQTPVANESTLEVMQSATGLIGDLFQSLTADKLNSTAAAAASTLALTSTVFGRYWCMKALNIDALTFPNLYTLILSGSGGGKSYSMDRVTTIFQNAVADVGDILPGRYLAARPPSEDEEDDAPDAGEIMARISGIVAGGRVTSVGGLHADLTDRPLRLLKLDEFHDIIAKWVGPRANEHKAELVEFLKELSTKGGSHVDSSIQSKREDRKLTVHNPYLSILAAATTNDFDDAVPPKLYRDGFMGRFIVFRDPHMTPEDIAQRERLRVARLMEGTREIAFDPVVAEITSILKHRSEGEGNLSFNGLIHSEIPIRPRVVHVSPAGREALGKAFLFMSAEAERGDSIRRKDAPLWARAFELVQKVALLHALGRNWRDPLIDEQDAMFAVRLVYANTAPQAMKATEVQIESTDRFNPSRQRQKIWDLINKKGGEATVAYLKQHGNLSKDEAKQICDELVQDGVLSVVMTTRRDSFKYKIVRKLPK